MNVASECSVGEKLTEDDTGRIRANLILFYFNAFGFLLHAKCTANKKKSMKTIDGTSYGQ